MKVKSIGAIILLKSDDDFIAKQLSHNALSGMDNEEILRTLWQQIESVEAKLYSGLDKAIVEGLEMPSIPPIDMKLEYEQVTLLFVGSECDQVEKVMQEIRRRGIMSPTNWVECFEHYEEVAKAIKTLATRENVHNTATLVVTMARYAMEYLKMVDAGEVTQETRSTTS